MKLNLQSNMKDVQARVAGLGRQLPFVAAVALTRSAKDAQGAIREEMTRVFDRPTSYALNGTFLKAATRQSLEARVWVKDNPFGKGTPADRFLLPHINGGSRVLKGMERALQAANLMPPGQFAVPAAGAQIDANGNVKRSQITQIMSQLKVQQRAGYESRRSNSAASKRAVSRQGVTYFALTTMRRGLPPGIYLRRQFAQGGAIKPVFLFVSRAAYKARLPFHKVGTDTAMRSFDRHFEAAARRAIGDARLRR